MDRRQFLRATTTQGAFASLSMLPPAICQALEIDAHRVTGTLEDVAHIVVLTQENRSFDHYFGALTGVRGFSDRFPVPIAGSSQSTFRSVWQQPRLKGNSEAGFVLPFHLDTKKNFALMRAQGTPHTWPDAQEAWDHGRMGQWTRAKGSHAMGYYRQADLPFHYALADAFTICDAYHCSFPGGTNTNRLFLWTGTNDPHGLGNGPATYNDLDSLDSKTGIAAYTWTSYPERLQAAGISWQIYQDMADNYDNNPLAGFKAFRDAYAGLAGAPTEFKTRALSTRDLDHLKADVQANKLPQVSWIVANAEHSEHPERSSPAQGAEYTARVLQALTSNAEVWRRTVLIVNFDENDGYFDHMPPPAVPSRTTSQTGPTTTLWAGASTVDTRGEYHEKLVSYHNGQQELDLLHRAYGLGPRVPMLVISPWSRGGWVNSQVFDHTSIIRFMERRFGVMEPNISPWRRVVCGDLTSTLDFCRSDHSPLRKFPETAALAKRALTLPKRTLATAPASQAMPSQLPGTRPSRGLPYQLQVNCSYTSETFEMALTFINSGAAGAVFHVYDRLQLNEIPRRYTVEPDKQLSGTWPLQDRDGAYDFWVMAPNGFHRHFTGTLPRISAAGHAAPEIEVGYKTTNGELIARLCNTGLAACTFELQASTRFNRKSLRYRVPGKQHVILSWQLKPNGYWYDFTLLVRELPGFSRRFAGRMETGAHSISDPQQGQYISTPAHADRSNTRFF